MPNARCANVRHRADICARRAHARHDRLTMPAGTFRCAATLVFGARPAQYARAPPTSQEWSSMMNRTIATLAAGALAVAFAAAPVAAQNLPPPGNVNPGSLNSGAEETGAENQARSWGYSPGYYGSTAPGVYYAPGYDAYAAQPGMSYGPFTPFGYAPGSGPYGLGSGGAGAIGANN
jgi:hypothetical protein